MAVSKTSLVLFLLAATVTGCSDDKDYSTPSYSAQAPTCLCAPTQARNMGQLLLQSNPLVEMDQARWNNYTSWISSNAQLLTANGPTMSCARELGNALVYQGLQSFGQADYEGSYGRVLEMGGTIEQAQDVAGSMRSGALDAFMTGKELIWLAEVIPQAAQGNWQPFLNTGTESRLQFRQVIPLLQQAGLGADLGQIAPLIDQFGPMVEEQMVMAACLFRR